jgi:geranylgeranyl reductase family protein
MIHDVAIVGAGPAGAYLAYLLAAAGMRVAVLDKERFPREKVCGGGLSRKTLDLIAFDVAPVVQQTITGAFLTYCNATTLVREFDRAAGCTVLRCDFDDYLVRQAIGKGARFFPGTGFINALMARDSVAVTTTSGTLKARWLIGADGVSSTVRNALFGKRVVKYAPALEALIRVPSDALQRFEGHVLFDFGGMSRGYGWIFPKRDHLNVGVYSIFGSDGLRAHLARFIARYASLRGHDRIRYRGYAIPLRNERRMFERSRAWLIGDAAGFAESIYGEGIYFAIRSATLAYRTFSDNGFDPPPSAYSSRVEKEIVPELRASARIARPIYAAQQFAFKRIAQNDYLHDLFLRLMLGRITYRECALQLALSSPRWLLPRRSACAQAIGL